MFVCLGTKGVEFMKRMLVQKVLIPKCARPTKLFRVIQEEKNI